MKKTSKRVALAIVLMIVTVIVIVSCASCSNTSNTKGSQDRTRNVTNGEGINKEQMVNSLNDFSFDIFNSIEKEIRDQDKDSTQNIFISPFSIYTALSMTNNGAGSNLRDGMSKLLNISDYDINKVNESLKSITNTLEDDSRNVKLMVSNSIWQKDGFKVFDSFKSVLSTCYGAVIESVNFGDPKTKDKINKWISDSTNGLIKNMISKTSSGDVMYLVNAIYFYGQWLRKFDKDLIKDGDFVLLNGKKTKTKMMNASGNYMYTETPDMKALRLSYGKLKDGLTDDQKRDEIFKTDEHISMYVLLPKDEKTVYDALDKLNNDYLNKMINRMNSTKVDLSIPKFKIDFGDPYKEILDNLTSLGMPVSDDFSNMCDDSGNLFISKVLHQAIVEVNEEGTEAAAATVVAVTRGMAMSMEFNANKPFIFIIRDDKTKAILFAGVLKDPSKN